ncbi:hypothetical protein GWK47_018381 [Chionoecetes opilio]|uniref:Uncharacterized protein n=1 Tax=Chionoecetes opilio TaxID=41210 RepID=A0A8J4XR49_CHIOP|nr:hypothetical protein GWK47_018381 [Chionoecetes opilio]
MTTILWTVTPSVLKSPRCILAPTGIVSFTRTLGVGSCTTALISIRCESCYDLIVNKETSREHAEVNVQVGDDEDVELRGQDVVVTVKSFTDLLSRGRLVCPSLFTVALTKDVCHIYRWLWKEKTTRYTLFGCSKPKATFQQAGH